MMKIRKSPSKKKRFGFFKALLLFSLIALLAFSGINLYIMAYASPFIYGIDDLPDSDYQAVMALGAKVAPNGTLSYSLRDRVQYAVQLYQNSYADKVLLSGDHGSTEYDEVNAMMDYAETFGIPAEDIFLDHAGFDTYDSMVRAKKVFGCDKIIVVTQPFHLYRAIYIARKNGINAVGVRADQTRFVRRIVVKNQVREFLARIKAFGEVEILKPQPQYLGDSIPISGDGTLTHDKDQ